MEYSRRQTDKLTGVSKTCSSGYSFAANDYCCSAL